MKQKISTQLAAGFAFIVLITVAVISITANGLISHQFEQYVAQQRKMSSEQLAQSLSFQYHAEDGTWNVDYIHGLGMYALKDGYLIRLSDAEGQVIWDAENHDMTLCHQIMQDIRTQMSQRRPDLDGNFTTYRYDLKQNDEVIGYLDVSYYSPYYLNESDFRFLDSLNRILLVVGICAAVAAAAAGAVLAKSLSVPLLKVTEITRKISDGDYGARLENENGQTQEIAALSGAVNHMAESLERQETLRRRLTSDVAHELRTPVANVSLNLEMMLDEVWEPTKDRLQSCYEELGRISGIISDLEKLRQMEAENMNLELEPVNLLELAQAVETAFEPDLKKKKLTCEVSGEAAAVMGDQRRLHQVIFNLVSNAVKYSTEGGSIQIRVKQEKHKAVLIVEDQGIGMAEEELPLIFERFYRTDLSRSRKTGGAGIGLAIVKAIVQAHQGTVTVTSKVGCGSRFTVTLPAGEETH
ncbi:MAG: HAMP domain-containing sensor histidine kinase [Lachnospiraceae bacterium]